MESVDGAESTIAMPVSEKEYYTGIPDSKKTVVKKLPSW